VAAGALGGEDGPHLRDDVLSRFRKAVARTGHPRAAGGRADRHAVKPWFQGKLDFSPAVLDLSDDGFVLAGGRLDYVNGRPVAALVYRRRQHVINLLTWPAAPGEETSPRIEARQGYHLASWKHQGMSWWAVSDLNPEELAEFAQLLRRQQ
jgi:anti-sigma factor RsiW